MSEQAPQPNPESKFATTDPKLVEKLLEARRLADSRPKPQPDPVLADEIAEFGNPQANRPETGARTAYKSPELDLGKLNQIRDRSQNASASQAVGPIEPLPQIGPAEQTESDQTRAA